MMYNRLYQWLVKRYIKIEACGKLLVVSIKVEWWSPLWWLFALMDIPKDLTINSPQHD